jgi:hypothetical protein
VSDPVRSVRSQRGDTPECRIASGIRGSSRGGEALSGGHFDIYFDAAFEAAVADQCEFLTRHLLAVAPV